MHIFNRIIKLQLLQYYIIIAVTLIFYATVLYVAFSIWNFIGTFWIGLFTAGALSFLIVLNVKNIRLLGKVRSLLIQDQEECLKFIVAKCDEYKGIFQESNNGSYNSQTDLRNQVRGRKARSNYENQTAKMYSIFKRLRAILEQELEPEPKPVEDEFSYFGDFYE